MTGYKPVCIMKLQHDSQRLSMNIMPWQRRKEQAMQSMPTGKWQYNNGEAEFIMERVNANIIKVTHQEQDRLVRAERRLGRRPALRLDHLEARHQGQRN